MAGIYIHIPFCKTRCIYCDFYSTRLFHKKDAYIDAVCKEISLRKNYLANSPVKTIYLGGGTPSLLSKADFAKIFATLNEWIGLDAVEEITLEVNPEDISEAYLEVLAEFPFNRISMGIQSFEDTHLRFLHRRHTSSKAIEAVRLCKEAGYINMSIDLIYGIPGQTLPVWEKNLEMAIELQVPHISAYHLTYEEDTTLYKMRVNNKIKEVNENLSLNMFSLMLDKLMNEGFLHYEISNFALPGYIAKHNSSYWNSTYYLGLGASAHSYMGEKRHANLTDMNRYMEVINQGDFPFEEEEIIDDIKAYNDFILTRLRTYTGIDTAELDQLAGPEKTSYFLQQVKKHLLNKTLRQDGNTIRLSRKGIFLSDHIMSDLFM